MTEEIIETQIAKLPQQLCHSAVTCGGGNSGLNVDKYVLRDAETKITLRTVAMPAEQERAWESLPVGLSD